VASKKAGDEEHAMQPRKRIAVFGSFLTNAESVEFEMAEELGYLLAQKGFQVICGGHGGIANPLVAGVTRGGGVVRGVALDESRFQSRSARMNPRITETVQVDSLSERLEMLAAADGYIFFSGGIGTLAEFAFVWHSLQVAADFDRPVMLISRGWKPLLAKIRQDQMIKQKYYRMVHLCEQMKDAVAIVTKDYSIKYDDPCRLFYKEAVFFDLDGTIVESPEEEFIRACENNGYFFPLPEVIASYRKAGQLQCPPGDKSMKKDDVSHKTALLEHLGLDARAAVRVAEQVCSERGEIPRLYADARETLHHFKENGFSTGAFSSRPAWQLKEILSTHELTGLFDVVFPLERSGSQPDRSPFVEALEGCGLQAKGLVHIGINLQECCREPGATDVDSILLDRHLAHIFDDRICKIRSLGELKHLVKHRSLKG
jgi:predicted Rossmann-fold nucleotide-binding protein/phosphoglycolate phosphatase-like HAD superfamily hydrolase